MSSTNPIQALPPLKSFSLTHILYDPSHPLSIPLTLLSLSPIFLFVSYFTLLIFNRRLTIALLAAGQLVNEVLSWVLKRTLKVKRPHLSHAELGTGYAMPSSHAQAVGFLVAWGLGYAMMARGGSRDTTRLAVIRLWRTRIYVFGLLVWSAGVSYSRYHLHYHTPAQIIAGYLVGLSFGSIYFYVTQYYPQNNPQTNIARLIRWVETIWEGLGGVGGFGLGDATGGWGEGALLLDGGRQKRGVKSKK